MIHSRICQFCLIMFRVLKFICAKHKRALLWASGAGCFFPAEVAADWVESSSCWLDSLEGYCSGSESVSKKSSFLTRDDEFAIFWDRRFTVAWAGPRGNSENGVYYPKSLLSWEFWPNFLRLGDQVYYLAKVYYLWVYYLGGSTVYVYMCICTYACMYNVCVCGRNS